jgi:hypothetical protein
MGRQYISTAERIGRVEGQRELVSRQLARKCGPLSDDLHARIATLDDEQRVQLGDALLNFASMDDLERWLDRMPMP